jgi:AcrR family transcriptional regulator
VSNRPDTRARLVEAAERLFAEHGVDGVSLREINREAGARNAVAIQYHFTDRAGVLRAVLDKHMPSVEARRHAVLDQYEAEGTPDLRVLAGALVRPLAAELSEPAGGREFLRIHADLLNRPRPAVDPGALDDPGHSLYRWRALVDPFLQPVAARLHRRFTAVVFTAVELGRRAAGRPRADDRLFVSHLVDIVAAILAAPVSDETTRLSRRSVPAG